MTATRFNILGSKETTSVKVIDDMWAQVVLSIGIGLLSILGIVGCGPFIFQYIYQLKGAVLSESLNYAMIFSNSIGLNLLLFTCSSYLKIVNQTTYILIGNTIVAITNVLLDLVFVYGCSLGMIGNAIGSILALIFNLIIYGCLFQRKGLLTFRKVNWERIGVILWGSIPMMIQEFLETVNL